MKGIIDYLIIVPIVVISIMALFYPQLTGLVGDMLNLPVTISTAVTDCTVISSPREYALTANIIDSSATICMDIQSSDVSLDCEGNTIDSDGTVGSIGVATVGAPYTNITVKNCIVTDWGTGISLGDVTGGNLTGNIVSSQWYGISLANAIVTATNNSVNNNSVQGIVLSESNSSTFSFNTLNNNSVGIEIISGSASNTFTNNTITNSSIYGIELWSFAAPVYNNTVANNTITESQQYDIYVRPFAYITTTVYTAGCNNVIQNNTGSGGRPIYYFNESTDLSGGATLSELVLCNAGGSNITNVTIHGSDSVKNNGILLAITNNSFINNNTLNNNHYRFGIEFVLSNSNTVNYNTLNNSGIFIGGNSNSNTVNYNTLNNSYGVLISSNSSTVNYNTLINNTLTVQGSNNTAFNNTVLGVTGGVDIGISSFSGSNNTISQNYVDRHNRGIHLDGPTGFTVVNNTITNSGQLAIGFGANNSVLANNTIKNVTLVGISIGSNSSNITGNTISGAGSHSLSVGSSARNNSIWLNTFLGTSGVNDPGFATTSTGNYYASYSPFVFGGINYNASYVFIVPGSGTVDAITADNQSVSNNPPDGTTSYDLILIDNSGSAIPFIAAGNVSLFCKGCTAFGLTSCATTPFPSLCKYFKIAAFSANGASSDYSWSDTFNATYSVIPGLTTPPYLKANVTVTLPTNYTGNQSYCVGGEGNLYKQGLTTLPYPAECGPANITFPTAGTYISDFVATWKKQDSPFNVTYDVYRIKLDTGARTLIGTTGSLSIGLIVSSLASGNYRIEIVPWINVDGPVRYNATNVSVQPIILSLAVPTPPPPTGKITSSCSLAFSPASPQLNGTAIRATCNCTNPQAAATLFRNGNDVTAGENGKSKALPGGLHNYVCSVVETSNYLSASTSASYNITLPAPPAKTNSSCSLAFNPASPQPNGTAVTATCNCTNPQAAATLFRNGNDVTAAENNKLKPLSNGTYSYACNVTESLNYTSAGTTGSYTILAPPTAKCGDMITTSRTLNSDIINCTAVVGIFITAPNVVLDCQGHLIDGVRSSPSYGISADWNNVTIKNCYITDWNYGVLSGGSYQTYNNNFFCSNLINDIWLAGGTGNTGTNNRCDKPLGFTCTSPCPTAKINSTCSLAFDKTSPQPNGTAVTANCSCTNPQATAKLYRNSTDVTASENGTAIVLSAGTHNYTCNVTETSFYTTASATSSYVISKANSTCSLTFSPMSPQPSGTNITANCSCTNPEALARLYRNNTDVTSAENGTAIGNLTAGIHNYTCNVTETANYLSASTQAQYNITPPKMGCFNITAPGRYVITNNIAQTAIGDCIRIVGGVGGGTGAIIAKAGNLSATNVLSWLDFGISVGVDTFSTLIGSLGSPSVTGALIGTPAYELECNGNTIDGQGLIPADPNAKFYGIVIDIPNTVVRNCVLTRWYGAGILAQNGPADIINSTITDSGVGIDIRTSYITAINNTIANNLIGINVDGSYNNITNNTVTNSRFQSGAYGVGIQINGNSNTVSNNTASNNDYAGIYNYNGLYNTITNNLVANNSRYGIFIYSLIQRGATYIANYANISNNDVTGNGAGISVISSSYTTINNNKACLNKGQIDSYDIGQMNNIGISGAGNTCDNPSNWNDQGKTGCTNPCPRCYLSFNPPERTQLNGTLVNASCSCLTAAPAKLEVSNTSNLVGYWKLNNNAVDETGKNNGTLFNSPSFNSSCEFNGCYEFNMTNSITITGTSDFDRINGDPMTVIAWVYPYSITTYHDIVANRYDGQNYTWVLVILPSRALQLYTASGPNAAFGSVPLNQWSQLAATQDSSGVQKIYINGVLLGSSSGNGYRPATPNELHISGYNSGGGSSSISEGFNGTIDSVTIYNRTLSASEIYTNYLNALVTEPAKLYRNGTDVTAENNVFVNLTVGTYGYVCNATDSMDQATDTYSIINGSAITGCTNIVAPGNYLLGSDIIDAANATCINVSVDNVVLDCNNHKIDGIGAFQSRGIQIGATRNFVSDPIRTNVTIKNCAVTDWGIGTAIQGAVRISITNTTGSIYLSDTTYSTIDKSSAYVSLYGANYNNITNSQIYGMHITGSSQHNYIANNIIKSTISGCLDLASDGNIVSNNTVTDAEIWVCGNSVKITNNTITNSAGNVNYAILVASNSVVSNNTVFSSTGNGLYSGASSFNNNTICTTESDIIFYGTPTGANNTCDKPGTWNDTGTTGCTKSCSFKPSKCSLTFSPAQKIQLNGTAVTANCSCTNLEAAATLWRNSTNVTSTEKGIATVLPNGTHNYVCNVTATQNYSSASASDTYNITDTLACGLQISTANTTLNMNADLNCSTSYGLLITADNVTLNCQGHKIAAYVPYAGIYPGSYREGTGISFTGRNPAIKNCVVTGWGYGINADAVGTSGTFTNNTAASTGNYGILLSNSYNSIIANNNASNNQDYGIGIYYSQYDMIANNTANNNYMGIDANANYTNLTNNIANYNTYGIYLWGYTSGDAVYNNIINNTANNNVEGIIIDTSEYATMANNTANGNTRYGFEMYHSNYNNLTNNTANLNYNGIYIYRGYLNTITNNTASNNTGAGLDINYANNNTFISNTANKNGIGGIVLGSNSNNNIFTSNTANENNYYGGIYIDYGSNNSMTRNTACFSNYSARGYIYDISVNPYIGTNNTGSDNVCSTADNWNDTGTTGCTLTCTFGIKACGTLDRPDTAYTLLNNIANSPLAVCMNITGHNITFECGGKIIDGTKSPGSKGIRIAPGIKAIVKNCTITDWNDGISSEGSVNNVILDNTIRNNNNDINFVTTSTENVVV